eukprot:scpid99317/ scgid18597/ 
MISGANIWARGQANGCFVNIPEVGNSFQNRLAFPVLYLCQLPCMCMYAVLHARQGLFEACAPRRNRVVSQFTFTSLSCDQICVESDHGMWTVESTWPPTSCDP